MKRVLGLVEMTCGLVHASYSLPKWQAVKLTFFAPCMCVRKKLIFFLLPKNKHWAPEVMQLSLNSALFMDDTVEPQYNEGPRDWQK